MIYPVDDYKPLYYYSSQECPNTMRLTVVLTEKVDGDVLDQAVNTAIKRYPYFHVQLQYEHNELIQVPSDQPIVVKKFDGPVRLGTEESNGHVLIVFFKANEILMDISHYITDGGGIYPFIQSFLYYYFCLKCNRELILEGVNKVESSYKEYEIGDPFGDVDFDKVEKPSYQYQRKQCLLPRDLNVEIGQGDTIYHLDIDEKEFIQFSKTNGASPSVSLSVLMMQVFRRMCPDSEKVIVSGIACNQKKVIGKPNNYRMASSRVYIDYPKECENNAFSELAADTRSEIKRQNTIENVLYHEKFMRQLQEKVKLIPTYAEKSSMCAVKKGTASSSNTFDISYTGRLDWGDIETSIESMYAEVNFLVEQTILLEVQCINKKMNIAFIQGFEDRKIVDSFMGILKENNISGKIVDKCKFITSWVDVSGCKVKE